MGAILGVGAGTVLDSQIAAKIVASQAMQNFDPRVVVQKSSINMSQKRGSAAFGSNAARPDNAVGNSTSFK